MEVSKIVLPADFGIENLDCPVHGNIEIKLKNNQKMRANSMILSLHSPVFQNMFFNLGRTSVDMDDFKPAVARQFLGALYNGKVDIVKANFREFHMLAAVFKIDWLKVRCQLAFFAIIKGTLVKYNAASEDDKARVIMEELRWILDEAVYAKKVLNDPKLFDVSVEVFAIRVGDGRKARFLRYYLSDFAAVSAGQLDISIKIAGENVKVLLEILKENMMVRSNSGLGKNSTYLLENIDLVKCRKVEPDLYKEIFKNLMQMKESLVSKTSELQEQTSKAKENSDVGRKMGG